jgi:hypothetical protein
MKNFYIKSFLISTVEQGFITPSDNVQTSVYWYWINDNISKEAVLKDLYSMKQAGINHAFIGGELWSEGVWTAPYRIDATGLVKQGDNTLEIEVVNTWVNRLIGDRRLPEKDRHTWAHNNPWNADSPLQPSGLEVPVNLSAL